MNWVTGFGFLSWISLFFVMLRLPDRGSGFAESKTTSRYDADCRPPHTDEPTKRGNPGACCTKFRLQIPVCCIETIALAARGPVRRKLKRPGLPLHIVRPNA